MQYDCKTFEIDNGGQVINGELQFFTAS